MIAAVHLRMAVHTVSTQQRGIRSTAGKSGAAIEIARVEVGDVTILTQEWCPGRQQRLMYRAMWDMTVGTVFADWRMFKQKRSTLVFMTAQAGIGEIQADQFARFYRAMWSVAIRADQLSFKQRMTARQPDLGPNILVTLITGIRLTDSLQHRLSGGMGVVTITTGDIFY
jgi:hypothetical protein